MKQIKIVFCFFFFLFSIPHLSAKAPNGKTICLNMIVKNESKVIERCLKTVAPFIDYWVIVDTGSSDGTQQIIEEYMKDIPGELHEKPWVNFAHNRQEALDFAKGKADYLFFIDADEELLVTSDFCLPPLEKDSYYITVTHGSHRYKKLQLIKDSLDWRWKGVLHEALYSSQAKTRETLENATTLYNTDGFRSSNPNKYQNDAAVLEAALKEEPNNSRYVFYLAQSYRDAGEYEKAIENYEKRVQMGGWEEEIFCSLLRIAILQEHMKLSPEIFIKSYYKAYHYRPSRAEPLCQLANYYRRTEDYTSGYLVAQTALTIPEPKDILFTNHADYQYNALLELSLCAYWMGKYEESQEACLAILNKSDLPQNVRTCVEKNLGWANRKILEKLAHNEEKEEKLHTPPTVEKLPGLLREALSRGDDDFSSTLLEMACEKSYIPSTDFHCLLSEAIFHEPPLKKTAYVLINSMDSNQLYHLLQALPNGVQGATERLLEICHNDTSSKSREECVCNSLEKLYHESFPFRLTQLFEQPISTQTMKKAEILIKKASHTTDLKKNSDFLSKKARISLSINKDKENFSIWKNAFFDCLELAEKHQETKEKLSIKQICTLHDSLTPEKPSPLRRKYRKIDVESTTTHSLYLPKEYIPRAFRDYVNWLNKEINKCDEGTSNPIIVASSAYQRLVSIHPFNDANGRTARLIADYVLHRFCLPPAIFQNYDERNAAIFPMDFEKKGRETPEGIALKLMKGIEESCKLLNNSPLEIAKQN